MSNILELAAQNQAQAFNVIQKTHVVEIWEEIGAKVNLVGSLKNGLFMKHRDIDFHIYTDSLNITDSFKAMAKLALVPGIKNITYNNLLDCEDTCLEWHAYYEDDNQKLWQLDMMHILKGSKYDGYFEKVAERIAAVVTLSQKETILRLKYETPEDKKIAGIYYYQSVMRDCVKTYAELIAWLENNQNSAIVEWIP